jgi:DNA repair protein RecO (recombination protein O)
MLVSADHCICLTKFEYSETSQILSLFSREHGIVRVMAKGAHRRTKAGASRFDGGIDLLDTGAAVFTGDRTKELAALTEWKLREGHLELRKNLRGLYLALYAAELSANLFEEHDPHPAAFNSLSNLLTELATPRREEAFLAFELILLNEAGYRPSLNFCASCGNAVDDRSAVQFSSQLGGAVCRNCNLSAPDRVSVDGRLFRLLRTIADWTENRGPRRLPMLTPHQTNPLNDLLAGHIQHVVGRRLRMPKYLLPEC